MKLPGHATVIAYLALFVALGGSAYAVSQLPRNSVGAKQLKANAVTAAKLRIGAVGTAKLRDGAVTGAKIDEATLGRVPSAATAESAATAGHAASADRAASAGSAATLGGTPASGFLETGDVRFGSAALNACFAQEILEIPGWLRLRTVGDCQPELKFTVTNLSAETWQFLAESGVISVGQGSSTTIDFNVTPYADLFAISATNPANHALIDCGLQLTTAPPRVSCSASVPPAA